MGLDDHSLPTDLDGMTGVQVLFADAFMDAIAPAYLSTWTAVLDRFADDPAERATVDALRAAIREHGLRRPVWVTTDEVTGALILGNGMHRVVAAYLEGTDVPYTIADQQPPTPGDVCLSVQFHLAYPGTDDRHLGEGTFDDAVPWLRSFPLYGDAWADCDAFSTREDSDAYHAYFTVTAHAAEQMPAALAARARTLPGSPTLTVTAIDPVDR